MGLTDKMRIFVFDDWVTGRFHCKMVTFEPTWNRHAQKLNFKGRQSVGLQRPDDPNRLFLPRSCRLSAMDVGATCCPSKSFKRSALFPSLCSGNGRSVSGLPGNKSISCRTLI